MTTMLRIGWPTVLMALLVFGFAPGAVLRVIILAFERDDPRRRELLGELYTVPRIERPFWVIEQLEVALSEGLGGRLRKAVRHWRPITGLPPGTGPRLSASAQLLEDACAAAGVELGAYDREVIRLTDWEPWVAAGLAGWIRRAHEASGR